MNKTYKLVFNRRLGRVVVADETANSAGKAGRGTGVVVSSAQDFSPRLRQIAMAVASALGMLLASQGAYAETTCNSGS
ncbi:ESPR domain-containing protein, partial [Ralstonia psammae]|uniref:ESPR domain-containing protein n=1 Tax=Ralstonia psammae TaxID=3058598 RepID=UPI0029300A2B